MIKIFHYSKDVLGIIKFGKIDIKDHISPAEAETWTELGNIMEIHHCDKNSSV